MSITYNVISGDTFEKIARKNYGTEERASVIALANPGVVEPLTVGINIVLPDLFEGPTFVITPATEDEFFIPSVAENPDEVALFVDGKRFRFFEKMRIKRSIDSIGSISFSAPMESEAPGFKQIFKPFSFKPAKVSIGDELLFDGTLVSIIPDLTETKKQLQISCYGLPGVLNDCPPPASLFPLEFNGQSLREIAETLCQPFGIGVEFLAEPGAIFERVAVDPTKKVLSFLSDLAKQRNLIISSTADGLLLFWKSVNVGNPVARLSQGNSPVLFVRPSFEPQQYFSHITGINTVEVGEDGAQFTVKNERLEGVLRPLNFTAADTSDSDLKAAVDAKAGRMFGNMVTYSVGLSTLRDPRGFIWERNTTLTLVAPDAMIYKEYEFIISDVEFEIDETSKIAVLELVLPGSFSGKIPEVLPWDE